MKTVSFLGVKAEVDALITRRDGRVFGKMGHAERVGKQLYKNVPGNYDMGMFRAAVRYFRGK